MWGTFQQFPVALPACVEDLQLTPIDEFQIDSDQNEVEKLLLTPEFQQILDKMNPDPDALMYASAAPPGVVFGTVKMHGSTSAADKRIREENSANPVTIPLSVQQQQLDTYNIEPQLITADQSNFIRNDQLDLVSNDDAAPGTTVRRRQPLTW